MHFQRKLIGLSLVLVMAALLSPSLYAQDRVTCLSEQIIYGRYECTFLALEGKPIQFECNEWRLYNDLRVRIISGDSAETVRLAKTGTYRVVCYDSDARITITNPQPTPLPNRALVTIRSESNPTLNAICTCIVQFLCSGSVALLGALAKSGLRGVGNLADMSSDGEKKKKNTL